MLFVIDIVRFLNPESNFKTPGIGQKLAGVGKIIAAMTLLSLFFRGTEALCTSLTKFFITKSSGTASTEKKTAELAKTVIT